MRPLRESRNPRCALSPRRGDAASRCRPGRKPGRTPAPAGPKQSQAAADRPLRPMFRRGRQHSAEAPGAGFAPPPTAATRRRRASEARTAETSAVRCRRIDHRTGGLRGAAPDRLTAPWSWPGPPSVSRSEPVDFGGFRWLPHRWFARASIAFYQGAPQCRTTQIRLGTPFRRQWCSRIIRIGTASAISDRPAAPS